MQPSSGLLVGLCLFVQTLLQLLAKILAVGEAKVARNVIRDQGEGLADQAAELLVGKVGLLDAHQLAEVGLEERPEVF